MATDPPTSEPLFASKVDERHVKVEPDKNLELAAAASTATDPTTSEAFAQYCLGLPGSVLAVFGFQRSRVCRRSRAIRPVWELNDVRVVWYIPSVHVAGVKRPNFLLKKSERTASTATYGVGSTTDSLGRVLAAERKQGKGIGGDWRGCKAVPASWLRPLLSARSSDSPLRQSP